MKLKGSKVLVTGADGFIGSHLVQRLVRDGVAVRAFIFYNSFNNWGWLDTLAPDELAKIDVFAGDIRDPFGVKTAMQGCDVVFHLASLIAIPYSYHSPQSYVETNINGTLNVVQAGRELNTKKIVHTSTSETYGTAQYAPIDEEHPLQGQSPYSASKIGADQMALSYFRSFDLPVSIIRPFNTYGPRQSARAIIPTVISQIADGHKEIKIGDLTPIRDFNYVADTVDGFIKIAETDQSIGEVINIGSGSEVSIGELINIIIKLMNAEVKIVSETQRIRPEKSEVYRLFADISKAQKIINYKPLTTLESGLLQTINWFQDSANLSKYKTGIYNI